MTISVNNPLGRFRIIAISEGISYLLLLFIAMPLKYFASMPEAVLYTGWAHGVLFVLYLFALLNAWIAQKWSFLFAVWAFVASLIPFAAFVLEKQLAKMERLKNSGNTQ